MKTTTKTTKMVALQSVNVPLAPAESTGTTESPEFAYLVIEDESNPVSEFVAKAKEEKEAKKAKDDAKGKFEDDALKALFEHNIANPEHPVTTVKVSDNGGGAANVSFKDQYKDLDITKTLKLLQALGVKDPNQFVAEHVVIGFDTSVFFGEDGLNAELYTDMMEAIAEVAARHGVASPFSSTKVLRVKDTFHKDRWTLGGIKVQESITKGMPNTTSFTPVVA